MTGRNRFAVIAQPPRGMMKCARYSCFKSYSNICLTTQCSWGKDDKPRQKARTEAHFEALRKRVDSLQAYVDLLEGILAKCVCQDISSHLRVRPQPPEEQRGKEQNNSGPEDSDEEIILELTAPMQRLKARQ